MSGGEVSRDRGAVRWWRELRRLTSKRMIVTLFMGFSSAQNVVSMPTIMAAAMIM